ncbi:cob(I)yrinic acid a,c-diamide adenosyltransferase [Candidatus Woesearchaeota archaeon]|nr:cob(I)yrinic acid a,c-diamide adenosyltransferase [Nanoarchaeota archaeon]MCB9370427.1 cob(I)yrinic acid a,c-diamide adenosyltransferase [Candidatus Woesearchaeota archaeon]USN43505.1 MAG: cob(I)yrinic acid a,c-diamide adenosyltransferase [Candidatus Woesearchaeota archaeon]
MIERSLAKSRYFQDRTSSELSPLSVGLLLEGASLGLRTAFVSEKKNARKLHQFLENISLNQKFVHSLPRMRIDLYTFLDETKLSQSIIPQVEFSNLDVSFFWRQLDTYELVIFDHCSLQTIKKIPLLAFLRRRSPRTEFVFLSSNEKEQDILSSEFQLTSEIVYKKQGNPFKQQSLSAIIGNGRGKSSYAFGRLILSFIEKKSPKLIYFDKADPLYPERDFFIALKRWSSENALYGNFDFAVTGSSRYDRMRGAYREGTSEQDIREAKAAMQLLETALRKRTPVVADELLDALERKLLDKKNVNSVLAKVKDECIMTGQHVDKDLAALCSEIIEVK